MATDKKLFWIGSDPAVPLAFDTGTGLAIHPGNALNAFAGGERNIILTVVGTGTITVNGSVQELPPDFASPSTLSNSYTPIALADYSLATSPILAGSAGVTVAGATKIVELNTNLITWFSIERSIDTVEVFVTVTDNV